MSDQTSKHATVRDAMREAIHSGRFGPGDRLPSEAALTRQFGVSRITVTRAMRDLQATGLIDRRVGAGSFVAAPGRAGGYSFGLLIPDLGETDIFEPVCQGMMASPLARHHVLIWGSAAGSHTGAGARAWDLCRQYIQRRTAGVFFAPLEFGPDRHDVNARILTALDRASIPTVLLDRTVGPYPDPGRHDVVSIDHCYAGFVMTRHLLDRGCRRVAFLARQEAATSVDAREAGYLDALRVGQRRGTPVVCRVETVTDDLLRDLTGMSRVDGLVCANDRLAGEAARALERIGRRVPADVRLVGMDDVGYAEALPVPLTTFRQPVAALGDAAVGVMLERVSRPDRAPRETLLQGTLIERASSGPAGA